MASVRILNSLEYRDPNNNSIVAVHQGSATDLPTAAFSVALASDAVLEKAGSITAAANTTLTLFDTTSDIPATFELCHWWCDQDSYIQFVGATLNAVFKVQAKVPFVLGTDEIVLAANTTAIDGTTEPTTEDIASINVNQYSASTAYYRLVLFL